MNTDREVNRARSRARLRSVDAIQLRGHDEVVLVQALDLLRLQRDRRVSPAEADVGMVTFGFRQVTSTLYES